MLGPANNRDNEEKYLNRISHMSRNRVGLRLYKAISSRLTFAAMPSKFNERMGKMT